MGGFGDNRFDDAVGDGENDGADQKYDGDIRFPNPLQTFHHQINGKSPGQYGHQDRHPFSGGGDLVFLVKNIIFGEAQKSGGDYAAQHRRDDPTGRDLRHHRPIDGGHTGGGHARAKDAAHHRVGGRDRRAHIGGQVDPNGGGQKRRHHGPDKGFPIGYHIGVDNSFGDGFDHVAPGDDGACRLEDGGDDQGAHQGNGFGAHRGSDIVGNIVGADIQGHIAADYGCGNQDGAAFNAYRLERCVDPDADKE